MQNKYLITSLICLLLLVIGTSLAFFTMSMTGERKNIVVSGKELKVIYTDSAELTANNIEPGWSTTKTFTVQNLSGSTYKYNLVIKDLVNTFLTTGGFQYKIESTNSGYNTNNEWIDVPKSLVATDTNIVSRVSIANNVT